MGFKVVTWNINGLRSFGGPKNWAQIFDDFGADLICFQETKLSRSNAEEWMCCVNDFTSYFTFPKGQMLYSGYSGVATFCRESTFSRPLKCDLSLWVGTNEIFTSNDINEDEEETNFRKKFSDKTELLNQIDSYKAYWKLTDMEGRCVVTKHQLKIIQSKYAECERFLYVFNVYCPRNDTTRPDREQYQLRFYQLLEKRAIQLIEESESNFVMIVGDFNTAHTSNDVYDDDSFSYKNSNSRQWITNFLSIQTKNKRSFVDTFRLLNPKKQYSFTCWNPKLGGRATNFGSRIDYIVVDSELGKYATHCELMKDYQGSDHCPVVAQFNDQIHFVRHQMASFSINCTRLWPEFGGAVQSSITKFLKQQTKPTVNSTGSISSSFLGDEMKNKTKDSKTRSKQTTVLNFFQRFDGKNIQKNSKETESNCDKVNESKVNLTSCSMNDSVCSESNEDKLSQQSSQSTQWKMLFEKESKGPKCKHGLHCVRRRVRKAGLNQGREFFCCPKNAQGPVGSPGTPCSYFSWVHPTKDEMSKKDPSPQLMET